MQLLTVGLSHRTAPVDVRERFAFVGDDLGDAVERLHGLDDVSECAVLSTCNRTEVYAVAHDPAAARAGIVAALAAHGGTAPDDLEPYLYTFEGAEAVSHHLFRVAAGLDSLVLGETQVLGQVKEAYRVAAERGACGKVLHGLFRRALAAAKRVHRETGVGQNAASVSAAAVELARKVFGNLSGRRALLLGAGETAELVARHLREDALAQVTVVSRTASRAEAVAASLGGAGHGMGELEPALAEADIVICSTGAPGYVVSAAAVQRAMQRRRHRALFIVDIAVPRDVEPEVARLENVFLYNVDDLQAVVAANLRERRQHAQRAEKILLAEVARFGEWLRSLDVVPVIRALRDKADAIRRAELERALHRLPDLGERERHVLEAMSVAIVNKLLNDPTVRLKELAGRAGGRDAARTLEDLFNLRVPEGGWGATGGVPAAEPPARAAGSVTPAWGLSGAAAGPGVAPR